MASIFDLKTSVDELESSNLGMTRMSYDQIPPTRNVQNSGFSDGAISFRWQNSGQKRWIPDQSFLRIRCSLTKADGTPLDMTDGIAPNMGLAANLFSACEFRINDKVISRISDFLPQIDALETRMNRSGAWIDSVGTSTNLWQSSQTERTTITAIDGILSTRILAENAARQLSNFELVWTPPLSIFKTDKALPVGKYELILTPQSSNVYMKYVIESLVDKVPNTASTAAPTAGSNFRFNVENLHLYTKVVEGPRMDDAVYLLDLDNTTCNSQKVDSVNFSQKAFTVSPSTYALTTAYQDLRAGTNSRISASKFKSYDANIVTTNDIALHLNRMYITYAGQQLPQPDAEPNYIAKVGAVGGTDYTTTRYSESLMYNGGYHDAGGTETIQEWHERGAYYHFGWAKDGTDGSTQVSVHNQFQGGIPNVGPVTDATKVANLRLLLFNHSRSVARITISDGRVVSVDVDDA